MSTTLKRFCLVAWLAVPLLPGLFVSPCSGALYTPAQTWNTTAIDVPSLAGKTTWDDNHNFTQFDPSLGTLIAVLYTVQATVRIDPVQTVSAADTSGHFKESGTVKLTRPTTPASYVSSTVQLNSAGGNFGLFIPTGFTDYGFQQGTDSVVPVTTTDPTELSAFIGTGLINLAAKGTSASATEDGGGVTWTIDTYASGVVTLQYEYELGGVPEPSTWFCGIALLGIGVGTSLREARRRKTASQS